MTKKINIIFALATSLLLFFVSCNNNIDTINDSTKNEVSISLSLSDGRSSWTPTTNYQTSDIETIELKTGDTEVDSWTTTAESKAVDLMAVDLMGADKVELEVNTSYTLDATFSNGKVFSGTTTYTGGTSIAFTLTAVDTTGTLAITVTIPTGTTTATAKLYNDIECTTSAATESIDLTTGQATISASAGVYYLDVTCTNSESEVLLWNVEQVTIANANTTAVTLPIGGAIVANVVEPTHGTWTLTGRDDITTSLTDDVQLASDVASSLNLTMSYAGTGFGTFNSDNIGYAYDQTMGLKIKRDALKIAGVKGNVGLTINWYMNSTSARNLEVTIGDTGETVTIPAPLAKQDCTPYKININAGVGTNIYIGSSNDLYMKSIIISEPLTFVSETVSVAEEVVTFLPSAISVSSADPAVATVSKTDASTPGDAPIVEIASVGEGSTNILLSDGTYTITIPVVINEFGQITVGTIDYPFVPRTDSTVSLSELNLTGETIVYSYSIDGIVTASDDNTDVTITSVSEGTTTITCTVGTNEATIPVTVDAEGDITVGTIVPYNPLFTIEATSTRISPTGTISLTTINAPDGVVISWSSEDTSIATVDSNGVVTGVAIGSVTITATADDKSDTIDIEVVPPPILDWKYTDGDITGGTFCKYAKPSGTVTFSSTDGLTLNNGRFMLGRTDTTATTGTDTTGGGDFDFSSAKTITIVYSSATITTEGKTLQVFVNNNTTSSANSPLGSSSRIYAATPIATGDTVSITTSLTGVSLADAFIQIRAESGVTVVITSIKIE